MKKNVENLLDSLNLDDLLHRREAADDKKRNKTIITILAIVGIVALVAAVAYFVYKRVSPDYADDFDDYDFDFDDYDDEPYEAEADPQGENPQGAGEATE